MHRDHFKDFMFKKIQFRVSAHKILLLTVVHIVLRCLYGGAMAVVLALPDHIRVERSYLGISILNKKRINMYALIICCNTSKTNIINKLSNETFIF